MKNISRLFLLGASILVLLTSACAGQEGSPTAVGTLPGGPTASPPPVTAETTGTAATETPSTATTETPTAAADVTGTATTLPLETETPGIPVTGANILLLECQYCVDTFAHALLVIPDTATLEVLTPTTSITDTGDVTSGCNTVDTFNGRQTVLCRAPENTSLNLNVCDGSNNCQQLTIQLQSCPQMGTPAAGTDTPGTGGGATSTATPAAVPTDTAAAPPTATP